MVEYAKNEQATKTVADVVCPIHFKPLPYPQVLTEGIDNETGLTVRTYFGWCFECNRGFAVMQFKRGERWVIYKYQTYSLGEPIQTVLRDTDWIILNDPPKKPEDGGLKTENGVLAALSEMHKAMVSCATTIELLIRDMAEKRGRTIDD